MTCREFQERHRLNRQFFYQLKKAGLLPPLVQIGGRLFFIPKEVEKWVKENTKPAQSVHLRSGKHLRKSEYSKEIQRTLNKRQREARAFYAPKLTDAEKEALEFNDVIKEMSDSSTMLKRFCEAYPARRVSRPDCRNVFEMLAKIDISIPALIVYKAEELAKKKKAKEIKFVPHPIVWLLSHDWLVELEKMRKQVTI